MIRLIISILTLLVLTVFIIMNVSYTTSINLFGYKFEQIPIIVVILISIATGIIYSFFYYFLTYLAKTRRSKIKSQDQKSKQKVKELKDKEKHIQKKIKEGVKNALPDKPGAAESLENESGKKPSLLDKIRGTK